MRFYINANYASSISHRQHGTDDFSPLALDGIHSHLECIDHCPTPLYQLDSFANQLGVGTILVKDEGQRSVLRSFKALGGAHAVVRLVLLEVGKRLGRTLLASDISNSEVRDCANTLTLTCATDGNHGRSVAAASKVVGCKSVVFVHEGVSQSRADAIAAQGAEVIRVPGTYDDSVEHASRMAEKNGWYVVSDSSWPGYEVIPTWVMQGYLVMADEALRQSQLLLKPLTHVFLQAGVGGYAAAVAAYLTNSLGENAPRIVVVEPERAACLYESAVVGQAIRIASQPPTVMAMLECYEPSLIAWRILVKQASAFVTIAEDDGLRAMAIMAHPFGGDPCIQGGESGAAGLAGFHAAAQSSQSREALGLTKDSVVLVFNTEGATDERLYAELLEQALVLL